MSVEVLQKKLKETGAWNHLTKTLLHIIRDKPNNSMELFETYSQRARGVKKNQEPDFDEKQLAKAIESLQQTANLLKDPPPPKGPEGEEPEPEAAPESMPHMGDLVYNGSVLASAGVGFSEEESYRISVSINNFTVDQAKKENNFKSIRFFGKILGKSADYYVIECDKEEWPEDEESKLPEPMGTGVNKYQYWVSNTAGLPSSWNALPPTNPEQLGVAKKVRRYFTGNLNAAVAGYPYFPWKEAGYLRAQIAFITHSTIVSPKGVWIADDEAEDPAQSAKVNEEYTPVKAKELLSDKSWNHHRQFIMPEINMCSPPVVEGVDEEDKKKNPVPMLSTLDKDPRSCGKWRFYLCKPFGVRPVHGENVAVCAKSSSWPGAYCVAKGSTIVNVYVGYGMCRLGQKYERPPPPVPASEFKLLEEQEEPLKQPEAEEAKKDEEKKEE